MNIGVDKISLERKANPRRRILLAEDSITFQRMFKSTLSENDCELFVCTNGEEALSLIGSQYFDFVCSSFYLPDMDGIELCRRVRHLTMHAPKPFVLLTAGDSSDDLAKALPAGVTDVFHRNDVAQLLAFIKRFPSAHTRISGRVLYVEDERSQRVLLKAILERRGLTVDDFSSAEEALQSFHKHDYDLVLTDIVLEGTMSGIALANRIRRQTEAKGDTPIIAVTNFDDPMRRIELFNIGVTDYILKPLEEEELLVRISYLIKNRRLQAEIEFNRKQRHKEELARSESSLRTLLNTIPDLIWLKNTEGVYLACNHRFERFFGASEQDIVGHTDYDFVDKEIADSFRKHDRIAMMRGGPCINEEWVTFADDGHRELLETTKTLVLDAQGHKMGVLGIGHDITERKLVEDRLRESSVAFETHEAIVITDANAKIIRVNRAFQDITGYSADEVAGKNPRILSSGRHDKEFFEAMWKQLLEKGTWTGEIWDKRKNGQIYPKWLTITSVKNIGGNVTSYVAIFSDISERKASEEKVLHLAYHDPLTGLPNRFAMHDKLTQAINFAKRNKKQLAVMLIDLDNFKTINDTLGHLTGDQLLVQVAQRICKSVRQSDLVVRLGGDEFVVILPDIDSPFDAAHVADNILLSVSQNYLIDGHELRTSPSIGICLYPDDAIDDQDLIKKADVAMYHAKSSGRANYQFFTENIQQAAMRQIGIENDLRVALEQQQFILHYQPQLDLTTGRLVGVEALLRWMHPERGLVSPMEFVPVAEKSNLIIPIGDWVIQESCRQLAEWQACGIRDIKMSVNLAASQFTDPCLPTRIQEVIAINGLQPDSLDLEVTESMTMKSPTEALEMMKVLINHGQSMSIDDFGTGYSSLAHLKLFPISTLKIDRSFVKDIETDLKDASICDVTVLLAHKLDMKVVAEGVETEAQLKYLLSIGCEKIQGYLISKPLPADQAETFIRNHSRMTSLGTVDLWDDLEKIQNLTLQCTATNLSLEAA